MAAKREKQISLLSSRRAAFTRGFTFQMAVIVVLWMWLLYIVLQLQAVAQTNTMYADFNPFQLLGVSHSAKKADIKKAFHKMSLQWHPDKNKDPGAPEKFILVKKAFDALTDPVAKRNFERYGNPDGPTRVTIGVALPSFSKEQQSTVLVLFVLLFVLGVPLTVLFCCLGGSDSDQCANGVLRETMEAIQNGLDDNTDVRGVQSLILESGESTSLSNTSSHLGDEEVLAKLASELRLKAGKGGKQEIRKAELLFLAHVHRRHTDLTSHLLEDLEKVLPRWRQMALAMVDLAAHRNFAKPMAAAVNLHRSIVQAMEPGQPATGISTLPQVPHLDAERAKQWRKGPRKAADLKSFVQMSADERRSSLEAVGLNMQELLDVEEFVKVVPLMSIVEAKVFVAAEEGICANDIATLQVKLLRANLGEQEAAGAAHTPHYVSSSVPEAWWLTLALPGKNARPCCLRLTDSRREAIATLRFRVPMVGKCRCKLLVSCETYAGLDCEQDISFEAKAAETRDEVGEDGGSDFGSEVELED